MGAAEMNVTVALTAAVPAALSVTPRRVHLTRLMSLWRSAGWPCRDPIEIDLLAAGWVTLSITPQGHESLRLTDAGVALLAQARQRNQRSLSDHDRLAERFGRQLANGGRIVWRELPLRAAVNGAAPPSNDASADVAAALWVDDGPDATAAPAAATPAASKTQWRMARPDLFSVRNTTVQAYLQPMVHEIKVSRADLLSDLRHEAKRESYRWLCCECYYVFPADIAPVSDIPEAFGVWLLRGSIDDGHLELARPARHSPCELPFAVWMALAKSTPAAFDLEAAQGQLGDDAVPLPPALP